MKHFNPSVTARRWLMFALCLLIGGLTFTPATAQTPPPPPLATATVTDITVTPDGTPTTPEADAQTEQAIEALSGLVGQLVNTFSIERVFQWVMFLLFGGYILAKATPTKRDDELFKQLIDIVRGKENK